MDAIDRQELKTLVREVVEEVLWELEQSLPDPDEGKKLRPEIVEYLRRSAEQPERTYSAEEIEREFGLNE